MSTLSDWQYLVSNHADRCLVIGIEPKSIAILSSNNIARQLVVVTTYERQKIKAEQNYLTVIASASMLPFKKKQFDLIICRLRNQPNINEIHHSLADRGSVFLILDRKNNHLAGNRNQSNTYFTGIRSYFAIPSFENPWFIVPADDMNVIRYFILNMMSSRIKHRRIIIRIVRWMTWLGLHPLLLRFLPWQVIIGRKAGKA